MRKAVLLLLVLVAVFAVSEAALSHRHKSHTRAIIKVLKSIEAKIRHSTKVDNSQVKSVHVRTISLRKKLARQEALENKLNSAAAKKGKDRGKELFLIRRIIKMLTSDIGTANHPAYNCEEVLKFRSVDRGTFYIVKNGKPTKTFCSMGSVVKNSVIMWAGGCPSHSRGSGWRYLCNRGTRFTSSLMSRYVARENQWRFKVVTEGYYRVNAFSMCHNGGWRNCHMYLHSNRYGLSSTQARGHSWRTVNYFAILKFQQNDWFGFRVHASGSNPYRWHSWSSGYNREEVEYLGKNVKTYMGGCKSHGRSSKWQNYCLNHGLINTIGSYAGISSNGNMKIKKSGYYNLHAWAIQHGGDCQRRGRIRLNGKLYHYGFSHANGGWSDNHMQALMKLNAGDKVVVQYYSDCGNRYNYHARWHSYLQLTYKGPTTPAVVGGCSRRTSSGGWRRYCMDSIRFNNVKQHLDVNPNGMFKAKKAGLYRVNSWTTGNTAHNWAWRYMQIVQSRAGVVAYDRRYAHFWTNQMVMATLNLRKGDTFYVRVNVAGGGRVGAGSFKEAGSETSVEYVGNLQK